MIYLLYFVIALSIILFFVVIIFVSFIFVVYTGAPFVGTDKKKINTIIRMSKCKEYSKMLDLGSGDGRLVIAMAKQGAEAHGYEVNPFLVWWSKWRIKKLGLSDKAFIYRQDFWKQNISSFDVVVVFGSGNIMEKLEKKIFNELKSPSRIISNGFPFPNRQHTEKENQLYLYKI